MAKIDDSVKKKVPELRFKGFTDDWEERKAKEMIKTHNFRSYLAQPNDVGNYEVIQQGDKPIAGYANGEPFEYFYDVTLFGDHTVSLFKPTKPFFIATDGVKIISADEFDGRYFYVTLERYKPASQGYKRHFTILKNEDIWFTTNKDEQVKIGTFFKQLDETIALHQRKLDLLKEQKKGYLQKMFPKNGEKIPELRFAGFADDWEQRKVGNFLSESKIKGSDGSVSKKLTVKLWRKGIVPKEEIYKGSSATQYYIRLAGQFMYGKLDFLNQAFGILPNELDGYESTLDSPAFDFKDGINPNFFLEYVCQENFYKYQGNIANGSRKAKRIHADTFFDMPITIPSFEEQEKIGSFFKQLDDTIALHQRKLDLLKEQKKGFLQKMFV